MVLCGCGLLNNAAPAEKLLMLGNKGFPGYQHVARVMSGTQQVLERCM
jgi:hypothetical protein